MANVRRTTFDLFVHIQVYSHLKIDVITDFQRWPPFQKVIRKSWSKTPNTRSEKQDLGALFASCFGSVSIALCIRQQYNRCCSQQFFRYHSARKAKSTSLLRTLWTHFHQYFPQKQHQRTTFSFYQIVTFTLLTLFPGLSKRLSPLTSLLTLYYSTQYGSL